MALSEKTVNKHNIRRAEVFAANGLCDLDVAFAHPKFDGYGEAECVLCGKQHIKWLFSIRFDAPDVLTALGKITTDITRTDAVTLAPVGSKCITDWLDAVPESAAKLEALKRWDAEMAKAKAAKAAKAVQSALEKGGFASQAELSAALYSAVADIQTFNADVCWRDRKKLRDHAASTKCENIRSAGTIKTVIVLLEMATKMIETAKAASPSPTPEETPVPKDDLACLSDEDRDLIVRARELWSSGKVKANLNDDQSEALIDIAKRVKAQGGFASDKQYWFFRALIKKADPEAPKAPAKKAPAKPGDDSFRSESGLVGARY